MAATTPPLPASDSTARQIDASTSSRGAPHTSISRMSFCASRSAPGVCVPRGVSSTCMALFTAAIVAATTCLRLGFVRGVGGFLPDFFALAPKTGPSDLLRRTALTGGWKYVHRKRRDIAATLERADLADTLLAHFVDAQDGMHRQHRALDAFEL